MVLRHSLRLYIGQSQNFYLLAYLSVNNDDDDEVLVNIKFYIKQQKILFWTEFY